MSVIESYYQKAYRTPSDINEHLPVLKKYADGCAHVTEFGVRWVCSTWAFLNSSADKIISYDIAIHSDMENVKSVARLENLDYDFIVGDTLKIDIDQTDLLFIDTLHNYEQLKGELNRHHKKVNKYIILHDTTTFGEIGENPYSHASKELRGFSGKGLWFAVEEFLQENKEWSLKERLHNNNGLTILERK